MVEALTHTPNVVANIAGMANWLSANQTWWLTPSLWPHLRRRDRAGVVAPSDERDDDDGVSAHCPQSRSRT